MRWGLWIGVFALFYGCTVKAPESSMDVVTGSAPGSWSATKQAKSGVDGSG
jgi:hypothetical protein